MRTPISTSIKKAKPWIKASRHSVSRLAHGTHQHIRKIRHSTMPARRILIEKAKQTSEVALNKTSQLTKQTMPTVKKSFSLFFFGGVSRFWVSLAIVIAALSTSVAAFLIINGLIGQPTSDVVLSVLILNAVFVLTLGGIVGYQLWQLSRARKLQTAGSSLHFRLAGIFSLVALFPAVLLAIFATVSIERTFEQVFSSRVKSIVKNSVEVADSYLREHGQVIRADMMGVAKELEENANLYREDKEAFERYFSAQSVLRSIASAYLIDMNGQVLASSVSRSGLYYQAPPPEAFVHASEGKVVTIEPPYTNGVAALKKLNGIDNVLLYAIRPVNPEVIQVLDRTNINWEEYIRLEQKRPIVQFIFAAMYGLLALTLLLSAIWMGLVFANRLVAPIRRLIDAAREISQGNLDVQLEGGSANDDIARLRATFKNMAVDLKTQRDDIMNANQELDERRRFIETVLSGVTAGVIGLDQQGKVTLINRSARDLLSVGEAKIIGKMLRDLVPEFALVVDKSHRQGRKPVQSQVTLVRESGERNFAVRVTREQDNGVDYGIVLTFDDVTELTVAQRSSAWADVARRIAHEIKNPLTPIQLSAERIRRKYGDSITKDRDIFDRCTDTIIRHVGDIGRMVDEFSSFARMPQAVFEEQDIGDIVREAVILFQMSRPEIDFDIQVPTESIQALCDRRLLTQSVTNLVKNAGEAIDGYISNTGDEADKGHIIVKLGSSDQRVIIDVIDNGCGLPKENRHRLVEPYMTTRQKGTGLGLAIVQRITEQHGGMLELADAPQADGYSHGAWIRMSFPLAHSGDTQRFYDIEANSLVHHNGSGDVEMKNKREEESVSYGV